MKHILILCSGLLISSSISYSQTALEKWKTLADTPEMAQYFSGIFEHLGVTVAETNEKFTVHHNQSNFTLKEGIDPAAVDFQIEVKQENVDHLLEHGADATINDAESFAIVQLLFTPMTIASLNNPFLTKKSNLKVGGVEELIHVVLLNPNGKDHYEQTLAFVNDQWLVIPGLHGKAERSFRMTPNQAIEYQRELFKAKKANDAKAWKTFAKWYKIWKQEVS